MRQDDVDEERAVHRLDDVDGEIDDVDGNDGVGDREVFVLPGGSASQYWTTQSL